MKSKWYGFSVVQLLALGIATLVMGVVHDVAAADLPKEVRIATVAYASGGKVGYNGNAGIIEKQGWLREELQKQGIKLVWVSVAAQTVGATVNEGFANKSIDFAGYGDLPSIILNGGGVDTRVVVPGGAGNNVYVVVPPNSTAKTIADLKGKRISLHRGRPWEITFSRLLAANGLKLSDFKIANLNPGAGAAALAAGNVDAFVTLSDAYQLEDKKVGRILWSTKQAGQEWKMRAELWGAKSFIDRYPQVTQIVANAYVRSQYWASREENFEGFVKVAETSGQAAAVIRREYQTDAVSWKQRWSPLFDDFIIDHYHNSIAYSRQAALIRRDIDAASLFDPRFVNTALKELKLENYWTPRSATAANKS